MVNAKKKLTFSTKTRAYIQCADDQAMRYFDTEKNATPFKYGDSINVILTL